MANLQNSSDLPVIALTDGANIALDLSLGELFSVTLAGNRTLSNPTNGKPNQTVRILVTQDATGSRTLVYGTNYRRNGAAAVALSTVATRVDLLELFSADGVIYIVRSPVLHVGSA